jgi:hypothetical protein
MDIEIFQAFQVAQSVGNFLDLVERQEKLLQVVHVADEIRDFRDVVLVEIQVLQILETGQFIWDGFKRVVIENQVSGLFQISKRLGQGAELVLRQVQAFATQHTNIVGEFLDAIARQQDVFYLRQTAYIPSFQIQFVEVQVDFFKTIQRTEPSGNVFDLVAFQVQSLQILATLDARRNLVKITVGQYENFDLVVFGNVKTMDLGVIQLEYSH